MDIREILIPQDKKFYESFAAQAKNILIASQKLSVAFDSQTLPIEQARKEIREIEHENDLIVHSIYDRLNESFITPIDSQDVLKLASDYDTIIDFIYATINRFFLYKVGKPDEYMRDFSKIIERSAEEIGKLTSQMGRRSKSGNGARASMEEIDSLENDADELLNDAIANLFDQKLDAVDIIKLKEIYEFLEQITDKFEDTALVIRDIALRYS